jgi:isopentenyl phosphate kinase
LLEPNHIFQVVSSLVKASVPAVGLSPFPASTTSSRSLRILGVLDHVKVVLGAGLVPVIHGDAVLDDEQVLRVFARIVSSELILVCCRAVPS